MESNSLMMSGWENFDIGQSFTMDTPASSTSKFTLNDFFSSTKAFTQFTQVGVLIGQLANKNIGFELEKYVAESNARMMEMAAQFEEQKGKEAASKVLAQGTELVASQQASYGASGAELGYGSTRDVSWRTKMQSERDANLVRFNASMSALGYRIKANEMEAAAKIAEEKKRSSTSWLPVLGAFTEAAVNTYGTYSRGKKAGLGNDSALETPFWGK